MANSNIDKQLEEAVWKEDLLQVRALLKKGADVDHRDDRNRDTLLHRTHSVEITKELLLHGARVNACNKYSESPLHAAITSGKNLELIRVLLKHGAYVDDTNRKGNTALNHAVKRGTDLEIVKELLKYGADINIRNRERRLFEDHNTPLDNAMNKVDYAKLLMKFTLIKRFSEDYTKIIDLEPYKEFREYNNISSYLDDCVCEVIQMKSDEVKKGLSLYELATKNSDGCILIGKELAARLAGIDYSVHYPIYHDIISDSIKILLKRTDLLNKLSKMQVYTYAMNQDIEGKEIILDYHSTEYIAEYLSNNDLSNFVAASVLYKSDNPSLNSISNLPESDTPINEPSTSDCAKRAKLGD